MEFHALRSVEQDSDIELEELGKMLVIRHRESATTVDVTTGATARTEMSSLRPSSSSPHLAVVVFNPDATRLLWATELSQHATVGVIGDAIVISTPAFKNRWAAALLPPAKHRRREALVPRSGSPYSSIEKWRHGRMLDSFPRRSVARADKL